MIYLTVHSYKPHREFYIGDPLSIYYKYFSFNLEKWVKNIHTVCYNRIKNEILVLTYEN